ncbi:MAG: DNA polymerase III subunit gamma/tau [Deltaproteobacteria bacterium]|nr:DNA polymerase III subunit gamma/tau [Deltaproteobacteria bacterium]
MSSYLVIARKWRPSLFEEIVGQAHVTRTLRNAVSSGRVAHAYLFSGPRGVGKTTAARILAKCLNCAEGPTPTPCNRCESCKGIASGSSVDVFEIDGASNTSVDNVRELRESVRYVPSQGRYKVYIIDEVHMLSNAAFNALLKTLEEPPPHAAFIFATTEVHKIPATILSRCQRFDFKRIPFKELYQHLRKIVTEEGIKFDDKAVYTLAREADGSLRDGQSLLEQALAFGGGELRDSDVTEALGLMDREALFDLSEGMISGDGARCLNVVEKIYDFGYDLKRALSDLLEHIRDLTVLKVTGDTALLDLPDSELDRLKGIAAGVGAARLHMLFGIISKGYEEVARSNTPRYSFEMALLRAAHCDEAEPVAELIERLEALKKTMPGAPGVKAATGNAVRPAQAQRTPPAPPSRMPANPPSPVGKGEEDSAPVMASEAAERYSAPAPGEGSGLVDFMMRKGRLLAGPLKGAVIREGEDAVEIVAGAEFVNFLNIKRDLLEEICGEYYKRRIRVNIRTDAEAAPAAEKKIKEADPLVKDAVRILGGRVIEDRRRNNV